MSEENINLAAPIHAATKKGKAVAAREVFMDGDQENLQQIGDKTHQLEDAIKDITATGGASTANAVSYSNSTSGMTAVTAQGAIDELAAKNREQDATIGTKAEKSEVATELDKKFNKENIDQESGESADKVMSQKAVSGKLSDLSNNIIGFSKSFTFDKESNHYVSLDGVTLKKGQYAMLLAKTTPAITTKYNGNASNMGDPYPTIIITDGFGEKILGPATSDGANLSQFGYNLISDVPIEHTTDFTILVMESADKIPVKALIQKNTKDIQKNTKDIQKNAEEIDEIKKSINEPVASFSKSINFSKDGKYVIGLNSITFKKGQYARVLVKTIPAINTRYNGYATNMTSSSPAIDIKDGMGELIVGPATEDNALIGGFGYGSASQVPSDHQVEFTIEVINSPDAIPLKSQVEKNTKDIQKNTIQWQQEGIVQYPTSNELSKGNFRVPGYTAIIRSWGFIGDSLCSGEMECYEGSVKKFVDMYEYSWGQQMCRLCGSEGYNYSQGGQTAKGWITSGERGWVKAKTTPHQAYIIALGVNDLYYLETGTIKAGSIETDVDFSNYENNKDTFAGNYFGIIQRIRSISKRSIIFVVSDPRTNALNEIIKAAPSNFENVFLIDLTSLIPLYNNAEFIKKYKMGFHMNATGYLFTAYMFMHYIDCIIQKNPSIFKDIALWNTNYTAQAT